MIDTVFKWSDPIEKRTKVGIRWIKSAKIDSELEEGFWLFWKKNNIKMISKGYRVYKNHNNDKWYIEQTGLTKNEIKNPPKKKETTPEIIFESCLVTKPLSNTTGLLEWQIPLVEKLIASLNKWDSAIDGSSTGAGKTYTSTAVARELGYKIGVICPLAVIESWRRVIVDHYGIDYEFIINYESLVRGKQKDIVKWGKIKTKSGYSRPQFIWQCPSKTLLIFDEAHKCKGHDTKNSKLMRTAKSQGYKILCCSATSAINPLDLRAIGYALGLHKDKDFNEWIEENGCKKGRFSYEFNNDKNVLKKLHKDMLIDRGVRITREEIPNFPECDTEAVCYNIGKDQQLSLKKIYEDMKKELQIFEKKKSNGDKTENELVIQLRARQKAELIKIPLFIDLAEEAIENGMSVVIFLNFTDSIKAVAEKLRTDCIIWGENKGTERQDNIDRFQNDKSRIILVSLQAGGSGISLHDLTGKYPRMSLISPSFSAINLIQALGRVWRTGAKTKAIQRIIYCANTAEEDVCDNIKIKLKNIDLINDGDLTPYTKKIFDKNK